MINQLRNLFARNNDDQVEPELRALAKTFYVPGRWIKDFKHSMVDISAFRDVKTNVMIFVRDQPCFIGLEPRLSAPWLLDSDRASRRYLDKEWQQAYAIHMRRNKSDNLDRAQSEFDSVMQKYSGD